jgi:hypothetical protein
MECRSLQWEGLFKIHVDAVISGLVLSSAYSLRGGKTRTIASLGVSEMTQSIHLELKPCGVAEFSAVALRESTTKAESWEEQRSDKGQGMTQNG